MPATHMHTPLLRGTSELDMRRAAQLLSAGHLVAFPTETVYGLGANALLQSAVLQVFSAKGRPPDNPLIVHVASKSDLQRHHLTPPLPPLADALADAFWPGPLTLVLPLSPRARLAPAVTAGLPTVAVRVPRHPVAAALLAKAAVPVAAPSANTSGRPSPTRPAHVLRDLAGRVAAVVDGDCPAVGVESTVVDLSDPARPAVLRLGGVSVARLEEAAGVRFARPPRLAPGERPPAPGMKYRHYAPRAPLHVVAEPALARAVRAARADRRVVGVLAEERVCARCAGAGVVPVPCGDGDPEGFARRLYAALREFDDVGVDVIFAVPPTDCSGVGEAVLERLRKAAAGGELDVK